MIHIIERFFLHFACSTFLVVALFFALQTWILGNSKVAIFISSRRSHILITAALIVAALLPLREPYDIWAGNNSFVKSIFDQISWFLGAAVSAWGLYRFGKGR